MLRPVAVALIALLLVALQRHVDAHAANFTITPFCQAGAGAPPFAGGLCENVGNHPGAEHDSPALVTTGETSRPLMIAAISGGCAVALVIMLAVFARRGAFRRSVDHRRLRRAKFQDDWTDLIRAADERAREIADRKEK